MSSLIVVKDDKKPVAKFIPRKSLFGEITSFEEAWRGRVELFDIPNLVQDQNISRSELRAILLDDEVHQAIETRVDALVNVDWRLQDTEVAPEILAFLSDELSKFYPELITNSFNARLFGYDVQERIYDYDENGRIVVKNIIAKPFEWFRVSYKKDLYYCQRGYSVEGELVDTKYKFILTLNKPTYKNPRGEALLAWAFWPWFYRSVTWQFWMQFLEKAGSPLLVGMGDNPEAIAEALSKAYQDAVIGIPTGAKVEAVSSPNKGESFAVAEDRLVRRLQKLILGQTLTSDVGTSGNGAKALGTVHNEVRMEKTLSDIKLVSPAAQNFVDALCKINFPGLTPSKVIYDIDRGLETDRAGRDVLLANARAIEFTKIYFERNYGFKPDEIEIPTKAAPVASTSTQTTGPNQDAKAKNDKQPSNGKEE